MGREEVRILGERCVERRLERVLVDDEVAWTVVLAAVAFHLREEGQTTLDIEYRIIDSYIVVVLPLLLVIYVYTGYE